MRSMLLCVLLVSLAACEITCDDEGAAVEEAPPRRQVTRPRIAPPRAPAPEPPPPAPTPTEAVEDEPAPEIEAVFAPGDLPTLRDHDLTPTNLRDRVLPLRHRLLEDRIPLAPHEEEPRH